MYFYHSFFFVYSNTWIVVCTPFVLILVTKISRKMCSLFCLERSLLVWDRKLKLLSILSSIKYLLEVLKSPNHNDEYYLLHSNLLWYILYLIAGCIKLHICIMSTDLVVEFELISFWMVTENSTLLLHICPYVNP